MCEQTEINYLDGDVVWVKLGACWWPGQVTGFHNLPEDIQIEFQKKPLIAAVKFFQEDTYEFVKNLHQIYKYNCTQKDEFIRKGLDKYRTKSKDGSSYMDKFPGDVEMAEKLTGGDPDILTSEKFCREERPDISALFGEKKLPKKKRDRDEMSRRSDGNVSTRKITHPRFLRESDHEIRIRQQPSSMPSTPKASSTDSPQFSCNLCSFTTTRVNVIICHRKSHCSGGGLESPLGRGRIVNYAQPRGTGRPSLPADTQKRKYVRKTKSLSSKGKTERESEPVKRKIAKQTDKIAAKKKKTDPELREKLLADWDDETDEDMDLDLNKSADTVSIGSSSAGNNSAPPNNSSDNTEDKEDDGAELIKASEKLLRETEKFASLHVDDSSSRASRHSSNKHLDDLDSETDTSTSTLAKDDKSPAYKKPKKLIATATEERKSTSSEKDDKQSRFSCFDFDEEDLPEPTITPVRKIPRIFGEKNTSVKKEILKKFTMSQAMKSVKNDEREEREWEEKAPRVQDFFDKKEPTAKEKSQEDAHEEKEITVRCTVEEESDHDKSKVDTSAKSEETRDKSLKAHTVTELEIVEIFEVEGEKDEREEIDDSKKSMNYEIETFSIGAPDNKSEDNKKEAESEEISDAKNTVVVIDEASRRDTNSQTDKKSTMSELATTETEDETVSELAESLRGNSENSDTDGNLNQATWGSGLVASATPETSRDELVTRVDKPAPRRRGRPRKSLTALESSGNGNDSPKHEMIIGKKVAALATRDSERKTSESDSERSYSGRRRKPNKRYLHSDLYTSSPDNRASKTDESQSETEEKLQKEHKLVRARGGKKKSAVVANDARVEPVEKTTDREFEFSNRTLATSDQLATTEDSQVSRTDEEVSRLNVLAETTKSDNPETEGESSASCLMEFGKKLDSGIGSPVNITKLLSPGESEESSTKNLPCQDSGNEKPTQPENKFSVIETVAMIPEDMELCADEAKSGSKYDAIKTSVDKLPPKKSQIKKFELSQIDLLDACEEQVAAEQAAAEKRIAERLEAERLAAEILAAEKLAEEKLEAEKLAAEKLAAEKLAEEKLAAERLAEEKLAAEKLAEEKLAAEKLAEEKLAAEKLAEEKLAAEKLAEEKLATEKVAEEKLVAEKLAEEKLAAEKVAEEKLAEEKLAAEKLAEEKLAAEKLAEEKLAAKKLAEEKLAADKLAEEKLAEEKLAAEKLAEEKLAEEKLAAEKLADEKLAEEKMVAEKLVEEKMAAEKLAEEKMVVEKLAAEELAVAKQALEQAAAEKLAAEQALAEKAETEKFLQEEEDKKLAEEQRIAEEQETTELKAKIESPEAEIKLQGVDSITGALEEVEKEKILSVPVAAAKEDPSPLTTVSVNAGAVTDSTMETIEAVLARITNDEVIDKDKVIGNAEIPDNAGTSDASQIDKSPTKPTIPVDNDASQRTSSMSRYKGAKFPSEISTRGKRAVADEEIPINSFQEAFLKTLHIDKKDEKDEATDGAVRKLKQQQQLVPSTESAEPQPTFVIAITGGNNETLVAPASVQETQTVQPLNAMTEFEGVEILVQDNIVEVAAKLDDPSANQMDLTATLVGTDIKRDVTEALTLDLQKIQDTLSDRVSTPSPPSELGVPVKKREKPRIIENVALKEPMQILKNKLLEKLPGKSTKHKLDTEGHKKPETKGAPRAKMMKMDSGNGKTRSPTKTGGSHFTITRKLQVLKAEEAATAAAIEKEKATAQLAQTMSMPSGGEKFIQASSQSLADMELDINSMPFVLSEDVLTPESIEHMPVVISSIIPSASTSVPTTLSLATSSQLTATNAEVYKSTTSETATTESTSTSTGKKKSGTPAILKNKAKAKPTITSIKTLVPPFAGGGVKGLKFQSQQATGGKAMPLMSQKSTTPGKYVIVQTAGGQQMRYSVQGKPGSQQKIAIPAGKATGSAQIVQQGGKVVILTSAQSGQTKMLPLNISKSMSGKVQKIVNNKGQIYAPMSPQAITGQKTMIAPKTDASSPTTSKLVQGQKILNTQGIITSKGVLTPISTSKTGLLGTLSQGIITKGGIYTPISTAQLTGKTLISGKTLVSKATTILSPLGGQALGTSKGTIIAPMSHAITGKTIINAQGIVTPKGTVLTPITGQQVKAIAAKSPAKAAKIHYQPVQQKLQLPMLQKCQKIPVSSSTQQQMRAASNIKSPSGGTIVFPNTASQKTASPAGKKIVRQIGQHGVRSPQQLTLQNASGQQVTQKSKSVGTTATTVQRIATSRGTGRQSKQKIVVQKIHESAADGSPIASAQQVKAIASMASQVGNVTKTPLGGAHKQTPVRAGKSAKNAQKNLLNVIGTSSVATSTMATNETSMVVSSVIPTPSIASTLQNLPLPPLVIPGTELPLNEAEECPNIEKSLDTPPTKDSTKQEASTKATTSSSDATTIEEPKLEATTSKITAQPQIMALPTESSDGTQTYVLVTIDEQGQIQPLDNNTLMSLEGTTQNADGTRTLYIDPSSLGEAGTLDNIVLQFDNGALPNLQSNASTETNRVASGIVAAETFPTSEIIQTSNQDILAAALANTDFQQEIGLPDNTPSNVMSAGLTQTSLINQTILQSTIIPPTEPISSPSVLETSLTLNQPIMTPLEVPSNLPIQMETAPPPPPASVVTTIPTSLELPITITNPSISYISAAAVAATSTATHIQIPGNSMPDIGEIMESSVSDDVARTDIPTSTRYLVLPNLDDPVTMQSRDNNESGETSVPVTYSVAIPDNIVIDNTQAQTTPSMPIIDDAYVETPEQSFAEVAINEMLVTKASSAITDSAIIASENAEPITSCESAETSAESQGKITEAADTMVTEFSPIDSYTDRDAAERIIVEPESHAILPETSVTSDEKHAESLAQMLIDEPSTQIITTCTPAMEVSHSSSEMQVVENDDATEKIAIESTNSRTVENIGEEVAATVDHSNSPVQENVTSQEEASSVHGEERTGTSSLDSPRHDIVAQVASAGMELESGVATAVAEEAVSMEIYPSGTPETPDRADTVEGSSRAVIVQRGSSDNVETHTEEATETSQEEETPSQSYEQRFDAASRVASDSPETPTQSATKSENSREPTQSVAYEAMEIDESTASGEPPTQSFEDTKRNEASQSYETAIESNTNAPTQSFNEIMQCQEEDDEEPSTGADAIDDQSFPTQSYEVGKIDDLTENLESDASAIGQEQGNQPSQSNDIGNDVGIGTSTVSINNSGLNEDETASSSYVPETPENQERDQDQESAISTSSYEIPSCEELNIASSSVIPDTSVSRATEHMSIHDNGVPEIPTSSYNLNPDSSSTSRVGDALPTSSYEEDQVIVEQNVSTSYDVPISMPGVEENSSQNFVTESTDHRRNVEQPTSYYAHRHTEVTASYYEAVNQDSNSRIEADPQEEVTPSYYEQPRDVTSEASQSYFRATPRYPSQSVSPSYYDPTPETEASQSSYYSHEIGGTEQSSSRNVEASQSFYQETTDERRLGQQGEATPTYTERYPVDYAHANSPMERHDLVESSVPATRPTER